MKISIFMIITSISVFFISESSAQLARNQMWNPQANLVVGVGAGTTKYFGEFTDQHWTSEMNFRMKYFVAPEFAVGVNGGLGSLVYNRRWKSEFQSAYFQQFYIDPLFSKAKSESDPIMKKEVLRYTAIGYSEMRLILNLLPRTRFNPYISAGVGILHFVNDDVNKERVNVRLNHHTFTILDGYNPTKVIGTYSSDLPANLNNLFMIPVGIGADIRVTKFFSMYFDMSYRFLFGRGSDYLDAFGKEVLENLGAHSSSYKVGDNEGKDSWGSIDVGVEFYLPITGARR